MKPIHPKAAGGTLASVVASIVVVILKQSGVEVTDELAFGILTLCVAAGSWLPSSPGELPVPAPAEIAPALASPALDDPTHGSEPSPAQVAHSDLGDGDPPMFPPIPPASTITEAPIPSGNPIPPPA
jgi:hypothetical protein